MKSDKALMRIAINKAVEGVHFGQLPFGACIAKDGKAISFAHNTMLKETNVTAHAEINAIREACVKLNTLDLSGCVMYCTCQSCPMCLSACSLANISKIIYGVKIEDMSLEGFTVLPTSDTIISEICDGKIVIVGDFLRDESLELLRLWEESDMHR